MAKTKNAAPKLVPDRDEMLARAGQWEHTLLGGPITYFPIRHHSPACARQVANWIAQHRPDAVIVEGPRSQDKWLPALVSDDCQCPIAILSTYLESATESALAPRHSAFFPLCDYSPEWVAMREGTAIGARVRFADLEFSERIRFRKTQTPDADSPRTVLGMLLADESHLRHSQFINRLVRRLGCRDFDELWDHLFESRADQMSTAAFVGMLATYCDLSRDSHSPETLAADATLAREAVMAEVIRAEYKRLRKPTRTGAILVVTGGFHTVALPDAVAAKGNPNLATFEPLDPHLTGSWLIRYSYAQLDALAGYHAGMPSPGFYDALWHAQQANLSVRSSVARLISTIARKTRGQAIQHESSVTDSIAALQMVDALSELRGHSTPTRHDLLDGITSCMRKESLGGGDLLAEIVRRTLAGDRIGTVPASAGQPPIVDDFQRLAGQYRLPINTLESRGVVLELYRKAQHRPVSFFLHQLQLLDVPFATFVDGPDFIHGYRLGKLQEEWSAAWNPGTEARLAELASLGDTVAGAAAQRLLQQVAELEEQCAARNADAAVEFLIRACRCGLHAYVDQMVTAVETHIAEDNIFASQARGLSRLAILRSAREPLEATRLERISYTILQCYCRACYLIASLADAPDDQLDASLDGLLSIGELLNAQSVEQASEAEAGADGAHPMLNESLFLDALMDLNRDTGKPPRSEIAGAAAGLLYGSGRIDQSRVCTIVARYLDAAVDDVGAACGVVRGLMMTAREAFWRMDDLIRSIDALFQRWEEGRFNNALPHMRLAFSQLSPREIDNVAGRVANLHAVEEIGLLHHPDFTEAEMQLAVRAAELMNRSLSEDGLQ